MEDIPRFEIINKTIFLYHKGIYYVGKTAEEYLKELKEKEILVHIGEICFSEKVERYKFE